MEKQTETPTTRRGDTPRNGDAYSSGMTAVTAEETAGTVLLNGISWSAVFAGVAVSLVAQLLLNMLGVGIGIGQIDVNSANNTSAGGFSTMAGLWWAISAILSFGIGGYTAGRLSGVPEPSTAAWHGLTSWAFTTLVLFYLLTTTVSSIMGGAVSAVGSAAGMVGNSPSVQAALPAVAKAADPVSGIETEMKANSGDQAAQRDLAVAAMRDLVTAGEGQQAQARDRAATALARAQSIPKEQALTQITTFEQQVRTRADQAKAAAKSAADSATRVIPWTMLSAVIALLAGAMAAWAAGREAAVSPNLNAVAEKIRARRGW